MTNDTILLLLSPDLPDCSVCHGFRIYEHVEKNGTMVWDHLGIFGDPRYDLVFPPVIKSLKNGKFIFSPQLTRQPSNGNCSFDALEVWEKNETLIRSTLELPINFPRKIQSLWIVQL